MESLTVAEIVLLICGAMSASLGFIAMGDVLWRGLHAYLHETAKPRRTVTVGDRVFGLVFVLLQIVEGCLIFVLIGAN